MPSPPVRHVFICAGDHSGDHHAARLAEQIRGLSPSTRLSGFGGPAMADAGVDLVECLTDHAVMGFSRVLRALPKFMGLLARAARWMEQSQPDVCVLVDFPGFNMNLAALAHARGIPVVYYICPQLWAWAPWRVRRFARRVDRALVIFPFEETYYTSHGISARFVGHPVADSVADSECAEVERDEDLVCLLPGSRRQEITANLPIMLEVAHRLRERQPRLRFHVPHLHAHRHGLLREVFQAGPLDPVPTLDTDYEETLRRARLALVTSGTATLDVALRGTPMVVLYKTSPTLARASRFLLNVPFIAQVNLIAGREVVPEFLTSGSPVDAVLEKARDLILDGAPRDACRDGLLEVARRIGSPGAARRAAGEILGLPEPPHRGH